MYTNTRPELSLGEDSDITLSLLFFFVSAFTSRFGGIGVKRIGP